MRRTLAERFGLPPEEIETLLGEIGAASREAAALMDMHIGAQRAYQEILDEAQDTLVSLSLKSQQQVQTFQKEVETLQVKASTDPLTGLPNRARFDEFFAEQFKRPPIRMQRPPGAGELFAWISIHFKKRRNDTHGHQAGDEVLRRVARVLRSSVRSIDLVARYGGEEFALVLTESDTAAAAVRAERLLAMLGGRK